MYKIQEENTLDAFLECLELGEQHYNEVEEKSDKLPYRVDKQMAVQLFNSGMIRVVTVRLEGELVGYYGNIISPDIFNSKIAARELGIYIKPEHRGGRLFLRLYKYTEACMRERGISEMYVMFKHGHNEKLPLKLGYEPTEIMYQKILIEE